MTDNKKMSREEKKNLKHADIDKFGGKQLSTDSLDKGDFLNNEKKSKNKHNKKNTDKKRSVPLALDIIIAFVIILLVAGLIIGAYFVFKNYADSYKDSDIQYTLLMSDIAEEDPSELKDKEIYFDFEGNTYYFGKITNVSVMDGADGSIQITADVSVATKQRKGEGFSIDGNKIAVGAEYSLRVGETVFDATIVEMSRGGGN